MAKCFDVTGYVEPCNVVRQKYTGRALLITGNTTLDGSFVPVFSDNGLKVTSIFNAAVFNGEEGFVSKWSKQGGKALPVIIDAQNPFGVTVQGNTDSGRVSYKKIIPVSIPATRDGKAEEFIMGLQKGLYYSSVIVLETFGLESFDGIGVNNDLFGAYSQLRLDPTSVTRSEYENGGAWNFNIVCDEPVPNVICTMRGLNIAIDALTSNQQPAG